MAAKLQCTTITTLPSFPTAALSAPIRRGFPIGGTAGPFGGAVTGYVARWTPGKGESEITGTRIRYPNGVVVSADGRFMYLNEFSAGQVYKYDLKNEKVFGIGEGRLPAR